MSKYQRNYWYPKVAERQHGEYCNGCGISIESIWKNRQFSGLIVDKINNDGNHNICDNKVDDFQLLCRTCNNIKNPTGSKPIVREMSESESTNRRAEKPLMEWLYDMISKGEQVTWNFFVAEGSFKFDISPETIDRRYYKKYFEAPSAPFELKHDMEIGKDIIVFKAREGKHVVLDFDTHTPTISLDSNQDKPEITKQA